ncbi:MAG: class I SAM-dependent methyltransferase [Vibrio sp.]
MKPARSKIKMEQPHSWSQLKNGQWVSESIQMRLDEWSPKLFGYHMLKLGGLSCELASSQCNIQHQVHLDLKNPAHNVIADYYDLPFLEKSIDVVILSHQLDFCHDPHRLLREVDRVLIDDGSLIITGFNPVSWMGAERLLPWKKKNLPWSGRMFTPTRVKDWLGLLNYQVVSCDQYATFPIHRYRTMWTWLENTLGGWGARFGYLYFIVARKRTYPLQPIKPHWRFKRRFYPVGINFKLQDSVDYHVHDKSSSCA